LHNFFKFEFKLLKILFNKLHNLWDEFNISDVNVLDTSKL